MSDWSLVEFYLSPIKPLFAEPGVTEICVNRFDNIFVKRWGKMEPVPHRFSDEKSLETLLYQVGVVLNQPCSSDKHPILDARLPCGSRICGVLYPVAANGTSMTI